MAFVNLLNNLKEQSGGITGKLKESVSGVASATGILDVNKSKMKSLVAEKAKMYEFIGMETFDLYAADKMHLEEIEPFCKKIEELNTEIVALEAEMIHAANICECGQKLKAGAKFCPECGRSTSKDTVSQPQAANTVECVCGAVVEQGALMCMECGRRITA